MRPHRPRTGLAREAARALVRQFGITSAPVPIDDIVRELGVEVQYVPLGSEMSGMAHIKGGIPIIGVNNQHHINRQRFTLAHELAHVRLHRPHLERVVHVDKGSLRRDAASALGTDAIEVEANAFASELLMPQPLLELEVAGRQIDMEDDLLIGELARRFKVSVAAMQIRLQA